MRIIIELFKFQLHNNNVRRQRQNSARELNKEPKMRGNQRLQQQQICELCSR